ncbi:MAG: GGDEF domain-containing protein [Candidatus Levybacteria bacterium]|nr:GGDEF domain-containing protein [Candidatus Levybacteria bacterium]
MSAIGSPEQAIKKSNNETNQSRVEKERNYLAKRHPEYKDPQLNEHARDRVAARLLLEKKTAIIKKLEDESEIDSMTGLLNLKGFDKRLNLENERIKRENKTSVIVYADLNNLKITNDTLGRKNGDKLIIDTANILSGSSRQVDVIAARCGEKADEYRIILTNTNLEEAEAWWQRVNENLTKENIKIAVGTCLLNSDNPDESMEKAEIAMKAAKDLSKSTGESMMLNINQLKKE